MLNLQNAEQMKKLLFLLFAIATLNACQPDAQSSSDAKATPEQGGTESATTQSGTDAAAASQDLPQFTAEQLNAQFTQLVQGSWTSQRNPDESIEYRGNEVIYYHKGLEKEKGTFRIDYTCNETGCKDIEDKPVGWCLYEELPSGARCKVVTRADQLYLVTQPADKSAGKSQYRKVQKNQ